MGCSFIMLGRKILIDSDSSRSTQVEIGNCLDLLYGCLSTTLSGDYCWESIWALWRSFDIKLCRENFFCWLNSTLVIVGVVSRSATKNHSTAQLKIKWEDLIYCNLFRINRVAGFSKFNRNSSSRTIPPEKKKKTIINFIPIGWCCCTLHLHSFALFSWTK